MNGFIQLKLIIFNKYLNDLTNILNILNKYFKYIIILKMNNNDPIEVIDNESIEVIEPVAINDTVLINDPIITKKEHVIISIAAPIGTHMSMTIRIDDTLHPTTCIDTSNIL